MSDAAASPHAGLGAGGSLQPRMSVLLRDARRPSLTIVPPADDSAARPWSRGDEGGAAGARRCSITLGTAAGNPRRSVTDGGARPPSAGGGGARPRSASGGCGPGGAPSGRRSSSAFGSSVTRFPDAQPRRSSRSAAAEALQEGRPGARGTGGDDGAPRQSRSSVASCDARRAELERIEQARPQPRCRARASAR
jgi:hypothetical protein